MAQASKRRPWVVEIKVPAVDSWHPLNAYTSEDEARMQSVLAEKRIDNVAVLVRYRNIKLEK